MANQGYIILILLLVTASGLILFSFYLFTRMSHLEEDQHLSEGLISRDGNDRSYSEQD